MSADRGPETYYDTVRRMSSDPDVLAAVDAAERDELSSTDSATLREMLVRALDADDLDFAEQIADILGDRLD